MEMMISIMIAHQEFSKRLLVKTPSERSRGLLHSECQSILISNHNLIGVVNGTWQTRPRELDPQVSYQTKNKIQYLHRMYHRGHTNAISVHVSPSKNFWPSNAISILVNTLAERSGSRGAASFHPFLHLLCRVPAQSVMWAGPSLLKV